MVWSNARRYPRVLPMPSDLARAGFHHLRGFLSLREAAALATMVDDVAASAPFVTPVTPGGHSMSCAVTGAGVAVWQATQARGYHYARKHPSGSAWAHVPRLPRDLAQTALVSVDLPRAPFDSLLLTRYGPGERLGLHVDEDERDCSQPIVVLSLGADALFAIGGVERDDPVHKFVVSGGDAIVMSGASRCWHHGVLRVMPVMGGPLAHGVRVSVSLRCVG